MTRRSLRVWMFAFTLLGALAVAARAAAKPPDLPINPNDTIPLLEPVLPVFEPEPQVAPEPPPAPMPQPVPGYPPIRIYPGWSSNFIVGSNPAPAPQMVTVYHAVRPRMPLSVQRTFDKCVLFGTHPLLSLVPLPESLREERHTQEQIPVVEPPLQNNVFAPAGQFNTAATGAANGLLIGITPAGSTLTPDLSIPIGTCAYAPEPPASEDVPAPASADAEKPHTFVDNLTNLIEAEKLYHAACKLVNSGQYPKALACLKQARGLCSVSRFEEMSAEVMRSIVSRVVGGDSDTADAEEQEEPPSDECVPLWYGNDDGSHCPVSVLMQESSVRTDRRYTVYVLRNASAADVANTLTTFYTDLLTVLKSNCIDAPLNDEHPIVIVPDPITNKLLISTTPRYYTDLMRLIQELDADVPQVKIDAVVAEVDLTGCEPIFGDALTTHGGQNGFVFSATQDTINLLTRMLKAQGRLDVLSHPQIQTLDNQTAHFFVGQNFPIITGVTTSDTGFSHCDVTYEPVGVELVVTPKIEPDGRILLRVASSVSSPKVTNTATAGGISLFRIDRQTVETDGLAKDGETLVFVGPASKSPSKNEMKVPCFCELPLVGNLFRCRIETTSTTQLVVVLTPHLVRTQADPAPVPMPQMPMMMPPPPRPMMMPPPMMIPPPPMPMMPPPIMAPPSMPSMPMMMPPPMMGPPMPMLPMPQPIMLAPPMVPPPMAESSHWAVEQAQLTMRPHCSCRRNLSQLATASEMEQKLRTTATVNYKDVPLRDAIDDLRQQFALNFDFDDYTLQTRGINIERPMTLHLERVTLKTVLELMLNKYGLSYVVKDGYIELSTKEMISGGSVRKAYPVLDLLGCKAPGCETAETLIKLIMNTVEPSTWDDAGGTGTIDYFPIAGALVVNGTHDVQEQVFHLLLALRHFEDKAPACVKKDECAPTCGCPCSNLACKVPGVEEQVTGLMKACHLAMSCGRYAKALQLAREAHALDAERVAADPVVYKMHLLSLKTDRCCDDPDCCGNQGCCCDPDCCCDKNCCSPGKCVVTGCCVVGGGIVHNLPLPTPCVCVEMVRPTLPPIDASIVAAMQKLLVEVEEADGAAVKARVLEVVEEESEAREEPKAVAKPYRVQTPPTDTVLSFDEVLKYLPGETWTEYDPKTNHVRALWRVRIGGKVYSVRYDGDLSVDLTVTPPAGSSEKCEEPR